MDANQIENWMACANALFGPARIAKVPSELLSDTLRSLNHSTAIEALREYRGKHPFRGFFVDRYLETYAELSKAHTADGHGTDSGHEAAAARAAAERAYWEQAEQRARDDQRAELEEYTALPDDHKALAKERFIELNMQQHGIRGLRILALDMWHKRNRDCWDGDAPRWGVGIATANRDRDAAAREAERERHFRTLLVDNARLRARLREMQLNYGEVVDVA